MDFPFYKPNDLDQGLNMNVALDNLSVIGLEKARQIPPFSVLVCCIGSIGKVGVTNKICSCNQQINAIIPQKNISSHKYLYYYCISDYFQNQLKSKAAATVVSILNKSKFERLNIPLPPLAEQKRIVSKIEQIFAQLDEVEKTIKA
jgi:type I restriction enzyme S subunit